MCASADDDTDPLMAPLRGFDERVGVEPIDAAALSSTTPDGVPISDEMLIRDLLDRETDVVFKQSV